MTTASERRVLKDHGTYEAGAHKTGYLYQYNGGDTHPPMESWHRTFLGALRAKESNGGRGAVYKITGEDTSYKVAY